MSEVCVVIGSDDESLEALPTHQEITRLMKRQTYEDNVRTKKHLM